MLVLIIAALVLVYLLIDWLIRLPKVGDYRNKHVFITGCDSGFGRALAIKLDAIGFPVFAGCLTEDGQVFLRQTCSSRLKTVTVDVTDTASIESSFQTVKDSLPRDSELWAVVNNAGVAGRLCPSEMCTREDYIKACQVNLFGPIEVARVFMPLLRRSQGRLINMISVVGRCPAVPGPYSVSKFGMEAFSDVFRREVSTFGVKVITIEPGFFKTTIFNEELFARDIQSVYARSSKEVQQAYGNDFVNTAIIRYKGVLTMLNEGTDKVIGAYLNAITDKFPRARYLVGNDAKFYFVPLYYLPEWLMDKLMKKNEEQMIAIGRSVSESK